MRKAYAVGSAGCIGRNGQLAHACNQIYQGAIDCPGIHSLGEPSIQQRHPTVSPTIPSAGPPLHGYAWAYYDLTCAFVTTKPPEYPDAYRPHADVQHIKKENIGLIEAGFLAILPPRLVEELKQVQALFAWIESTVATYHRDWADDLKATHPAITDEAGRSPCP